MQDNFKSHQELGTQLKLFFFDEKSPGSAFFLPNGTILYNNLVNYIKSEYKIRGYSEVMTPVIFDKSLWKISGHWSKYKDNMFIIESNKSEKNNHSSDNINQTNCCDNHRQFSIKPMNCPGHCLLLKYLKPSYKDLPIRFADFGILHRNEIHGSLRGLTRVRKFCQDDAHIFCSFDQVEQEIKNVLEFINKIYKDFKMEIKFGLSTRPDEFIGNIETWNKAESILKNILDDYYPNYEIYEKEGAFYGNKIDCKVMDTFGREHQLATIQLDFNLPERFNLTYTDSNGQDIIPVMIHRAIFGSIERFIGILLESTQGKLPFFVNPRQISIIPVKSDDPNIHLYCDELYSNLKKLNYNVSYYDDSNTMQKKIAQCEVLHYNYIIVIGEKEVKNNTISVRNQKKTFNYLDFLNFLDEQKKI